MYAAASTHLQNTLRRAVSCLCVTLHTVEDVPCKGEKAATVCTLPAHRHSPTTSAARPHMAYKTLQRHVGMCSTRAAHLTPQYARTHQELDGAVSGEQQYTVPDEQQHTNTSNNNTRTQTKQPAIRPVAVAVRVRTRPGQSV